MFDGPVHFVISRKEWGTIAMELATAIEYGQLLNFTERLCAGQLI